MGTIWLIIGGVRSGKSRLACRLAADSGLPVSYIATAEPRDGEMSARIAAHQRERPPNWRTIEEPTAIRHALSVAGDGCAIVDCLTLWLSNRLPPTWRDNPPTLEDIDAEAKAILTELDQVVKDCHDRSGPTIFVTNEVGSGIIPADAFSRAYENILGAVNQAVAAPAERVYLCHAGLALELKGAGAQSL